MRVRYQHTPGTPLAFEVTDGVFPGGTLRASGSLTELPATGAPSLYAATVNSAGWPDGDYRVRVTSGSTLVRTLFARLLNGEDGSTSTPRPVGTDLGQILLWARQRLVDRGLYTETQAAISLEQEPHPTAGSTFCLVAPSSVQPARSSDLIGRQIPIVQAGFRVRCYLMRTIDRAGTDGLALGAHNGLERQIARVIDLINGRWPVNAAADVMCVQPVALGGFGEPTRYRSGRQYVYGEARFDVEYLLDLEDSSGC